LLGITEGQKYETLVAGAYTPEPLDTQDDTRIYRLQTYLVNMMISYNQLRNYLSILKPSIELIKIIDESGIDRHLIQQELKGLKALPSDMITRIDYFRLNKEPNLTAQFVLSLFVDLCLDIWSVGSKSTEKLRRDFVSVFVKKILRSEELMTAPGYFSWSSLFGKNTGESDTVPNQELADGVDTDMADGDIKSNPFSMDAYDIEADEDVMGDDPSAVLKSAE
jgi:hypothetical protein